MNPSTTKRVFIPMDRGRGHVTAGDEHSASLQRRRNEIGSYPRHRGGLGAPVSVMRQGCRDSGSVFVRRERSEFPRIVPAVDSETTFHPAEERKRRRIWLSNIAEQPKPKLRCKPCNVRVAPTPHNNNANNELP